MRQQTPVVIAPAELAARMAAARPVLLMLDYDGTLVPIAPTPAEARPDGELLALLERLSRQPGLVPAVVSGRGSADLAALLPVPRLILVAGHGACWRPPGRPSFSPLAFYGGGPVTQIKALAGLARHLTAGEQGFIVEEKDASVALHYRLAAPAAARRVCHEFISVAGQLTGNVFFQILKGKKMVEIRAGSVNKGTAARFLSGRYGGCPVFVGDDVTDEDAFLAVGAGGFTVLVAARPRYSAARFCLGTPGEVRAFLSILAGEEMIPGTGMTGRPAF